MASSVNLNDNNILPTGHHFTTTKWGIKKLHLIEGIAQSLLEIVKSIKKNGSQNNDENAQLLLNSCF